MSPSAAAAVRPRALAVPTVALLGAFAALRAQGAAPAGGDVVQQTGEHFVVHCHGGDEALAKQALDAAEAAWPVATALLGADAGAPAQPLAMHLHRTVASYEAADQRLSRGKFQRNLAMTWYDPREAHVAVQPPCRDEALRALGLPDQTVALLAWEATHLVRAATCPNFADHPQWFVDGLAAHVASAVLQRVRPGGGREAAPFTATPLVLVQRLQQQDKLPPLADLLADRIDDLDFQPRYALRSTFFAFLAADDKRLAKVVAPVLRTGGGDGYAAKVRDAATKALGRGVDKDFARFVQRLQPQWEEVLRSLGTGGSPWHQLAFPDSNAVAWNLTPAKGALALRGSLRILPGDKQQLNVLFAREDDGFYTVAFVADHGFTVFDYRPQRAEPWQRLGDANAPGLRLGYTSTFAVEAKGRALVVRLDDHHWEFTLPRALPADVLWGLGAQAGAAGLWIDVAAGKAK